MRPGLWNLFSGLSLVGAASILRGCATSDVPQVPFEVGRDGEQLLLDAEQLEELRSLGYVQ